MQTPQLTPGGILFFAIVAWWICASAAAKTIEVIQFVRTLLVKEDQHVHDA